MNTMEQWKMQGEAIKQDILCTGMIVIMVWANFLVIMTA